MEYLNSLRASSLSWAKLALKISVPVMLLRNLDSTKEFCNGTRMIIISTPEFSGAGSLVGKPSFQDLQFMSQGLTWMLLRRNCQLHWRQFPVGLAFAMTINKSQSQSVKQVGLDLWTPVFAHSQLYVALSRYTSGNQIKVILAPENTSRTTVNIVYQEVLNGLEM